MNESYIPLAYLNAWEYCHRRFYFEHVLGEMADNEHIILGRHVHRHIDKETTRREGDTTIHQQQWVWSDRLLFTPQLRQATEAAIQAARIAGEFPMPAPINHPKKCQACSLQHICLPNEIRLLTA